MYHNEIIKSPERNNEYQGISNIDIIDNDNSQGNNPNFNEYLKNNPYLIQLNPDNIGK